MTSPIFDISDHEIDKIRMFYRAGFQYRSIKVTCPFCLDVNKSLKVTGERYNCRACFKNGTTASFVKLLNNFKGYSNGNTDNIHD